MKSVAIAAIAATLCLAPAAAFAVPGPQSTTTTQTQQTGIDHPDIPNCVVHPAHPYPNGVCETVTEWTTTTGLGHAIF